MASLQGSFRIIVTRNHRNSLEVTTHEELKDLLKWALERFVCEQCIDDAERLAYVGEAENLCLNALDTLRKTLSEPDSSDEWEDES